VSISLCTDKIRLDEQYAGVEQKILRELDSMNIRIFRGMNEYGPRNLLEVSRRTGIPFTSVYHRVERIESRSGPVAYLVPKLSKLGMVRVVVLATARLGCEDAVAEALTAPNLWSTIAPCEGTFTNESVHSVPYHAVNQFTSYISDLSQTGLVTDVKIIPTSDYVPNFPDFDYYGEAEHEWAFPWNEWCSDVLSLKTTATLLDPETYETDADKKDLFIVRKLEVNARKSYSELAHLLGITLYGVKYHFDRKLIPNGIVDNYQFNIVPYPKEVSAFHEIMLEFNSAQGMNQFVSVITRLYFVIGYSKVLKKSAILLRTYLVESQLRRLHTFFSELAKAGVLASYSAIRKDFHARRTQTISDELFDDERGWTIDFDKCRRELNALKQRNQT
jgi:DNA-binding Lrp family transcriptional regulator